MANRALRGDGGRVDALSEGGARDSIFPQPESPGGRLFSRLVAAQVPGLPVEIALSALAQAARLAPDVAASALSRLAADGLVQLETEPESEQLVVTVMLAPPLEDFGITPDWGEAAGQDSAPDGGASEAPAPAPVAQLEGGAPPVTPATPDPRRPRPRRATAAPEAAPAPAPEAETAPSRPATVTERPPKAPASAPAKGPPRPKSATPVAPAPGPRDGVRVDETVQARNFVERFERLLAECETWRRRAQEAEERARVAERSLATAERRAEVAEGRLATAQERLRSWGELTRRMQQLARQADSVSRARPARAERPAPAERPQAAQRPQSAPASRSEGERPPQAGRA
jgi:hypothetical protein